MDGQYAFIYSSWTNWSMDPTGSFRHWHLQRTNALSPAELAYQAIQSASESPVTLVTANSTISPPITSPSFDPLNQVLPKEESIREIMGLEEQPWEDSPHRVYLIWTWCLFKSCPLTYQKSFPHPIQPSKCWMRKETWVTLPNHCPSIFLSRQASWKTSKLEHRGIPAIRYAIDKSLSHS